jgi:hypothetical protein
MKIFSPQIIGILEVTGSVTSSLGFKGDLDGNAATATSASFALTSSFASNAERAGLVSGVGVNSIRTAPHLTGTSATSSANGENAISIGITSRANSTDSVAIGNNAQAVFEAVAIGKSSLAGGAGDSVAIGSSATANAERCIAIGANSNATSTGDNPKAIAIGSSTNATAIDTIAIGSSANAAATDAICIGRGTSIASGRLRGIAIGAAASVGATNGINIGGIYTYNGSTLATINTSLQAVGSMTASLFNGNGRGLTNVTASKVNTTPADDNVEYAVTFVGQEAAGTQVIRTDDNSNITFNPTTAVLSVPTLNGNALTATTASYAQTSSFAAGNFEVSGQIFSPTFAGSVVSSTSSVDFNNGNFATLSLTAATFLANPSNLKSGTTYTIIISSGSLISNHGSAWKFSGGTPPTYTNGTDVLTCVSDGTSLYATTLTDFQ